MSRDDVTDAEFESMLGDSSLASTRPPDADPDATTDVARGAAAPTADVPRQRGPRREATLSAWLGEHPEYARDLFAGSFDEPCRYRLGGVPLGAGNQGTVYRATEVGPGSYPYALKVLYPRPGDVGEVRELWDEKLRRFRTLRPNERFARPIEVFVGPAPARPGEHDDAAARVYVLMPWVAGQDLTGYLRSHRGEKHLVGNLEVLVPVAETLDWLQSQRANPNGDRFVHGDVKPGNIIASDGGGVLVDPDLSGLEVQGVAERWGTAVYAGPEIAREGHYSGAGDRFSLGKVVCEVLADGRIPPEGADPQVLRNLLRGVTALAQRPDLVDHVLTMLREDPGDRPGQAAPWLVTLIEGLQSEGLPTRQELVGKRRRLRVLVAAAVVAIIVAAAVLIPLLVPSGRCEPAAADARPKADGVLRFGTFQPRSGPLAAQHPQLEAAVSMAVRDVAATGIPSLQIAGPGPEDQQDEGGGADAACEAVGTLLANGADAIIGPSSSETATRVLDRVTAGGSMLVSPANTAPELSSHQGRYFRTAPSDVLQGRVLGDVVAQEGNRSVTVVARRDAYGVGLSRELVAEMRGQGVTTVTVEEYDPDAPDFAGIVDRLVGARPDGVVLVGFDETAKLLRAMIDRNLGPSSQHQVYGTEGMLRETLPAQVAPGRFAALAGLRGTTLLPARSDFAGRLRAYRPGLADISYAAQAYDAVVVTALAAASAGSDDPTLVAAKMNDVTRGGQRCLDYASCLDVLRRDPGADIDYDGVSGPLQFTAAGEPCTADYSLVRFTTTGTLEVDKVGGGSNLCTVFR